MYIMRNDVITIVAMHPKFIRNVNTEDARFFVLKVTGDDITMEYAKTSDMVIGVCDKAISAFRLKTRWQIRTESNARLFVAMYTEETNVPGSVRTMMSFSSDYIMQTLIENAVHVIKLVMITESQVSEYDTSEFMSWLEKKKEVWDKKLQAANQRKRQQEAIDQKARQLAKKMIEESSND